MINISIEFQKNIFDYNRSIDVVNVLPYNKNEITIQPNELAYHKTINIKLSYLYDNFIYLYSRCSIPNYKIPTTYNGFIGVTGVNIGIYHNLNSSLKFSFANFNLLDFAKNAVSYRKDNMFYLFVNCVSAITVMRHDLETSFCQVCPNIITKVDALSGDLEFQKINSLSILDERYLCVSDEKLDLVFKYDLLSYFSNENIFKNASSPFNNRLFALESLGGQGGRYDTIRFEKPQKIPTSDNLILVEDFQNKIFKLYDSNFDFLFYQTLVSFYKNISSFNSLKFKNKKELYAVVDKGYHIFNIDMIEYEIKHNNFISLSAILENDENILDINFSNYENNIMYILTNKSIIKKWDTTLVKTIGRKKATDILGTNTTFKWFLNASKNDKTDFIYIYSSNSNSNQILIYSDELDLITILNKKDFSVYSKDEVLIKEDEWNQSWVYEKSLKKILQNVDYLKNTISYRFYLQENNLGNIISVRKVYNSDILSLSAENFNNSCIVGLNENFQNSVINREILKIYDFQQNVLDNIVNGFVE